MKQITLPSGEWLLVEIPENATISKEVENRQVRYQYRDEKGLMHYTATGFPLFPLGSWSIIGKANELTEEQWKAIVDEQFHPFTSKIYGYTFRGQDSLSPYKKAKLAGIDLIRSHGYDPSKCLLLKKEK